MRIAYIPHQQIDPIKWDACIKNASNSVVYAQFDYLTAMTENWDAIIIEDYSVVMPLPWKKKLGIPYVYQPAFIQYLGIFSKEKCTIELVNACFKLAKEHFKYIDATVNFSLSKQADGKHLTIEEKTNYLLDLNNPYTTIAQNYHVHFHKSLRRIKKFDLQYSKSKDESFVMELFKQLYAQRMKTISTIAIDSFTKLCGSFKLSAQLHIREVADKEGNILACVLLLSDARRYYNIVSCITEEGKKLEANYFLYDKILEEFAQQDMLFDFKGSNHSGIASFYKKFNPTTELYQHIHYNGLPKLVRLIKR